MYVKILVPRDAPDGNVPVRKCAAPLPDSAANASLCDSWEGGTNVATALYIVIHSRGKWWVDFEGRAHGPHDSREAAAMEARNQAQFTAHMNRPSEVLVPDSEGKYWVVWNSRRATDGTPRPISEAAA
jgi:hypothetical protein